MNKDWKLCGCLETCFEQGRCWGHFEGVMCAHLSDDGINSLCCRYDEFELVNCYTTEEEYLNLKEN
jgi:hypothetical protein